MKNVNLMKKQQLSRVKEIQMFSLTEAKFTGLASNSEK